jgi:EmrB/QacA subfamily drug resistance transporter
LASEAATDIRNEAAPGLDPKVWRIIGVVIIAPFMTQMDSTIVNVSLSSIRQDLHSSISAAQWIISGYLLALALTLPLNGWLVDRFGAKRLYLVCFSAFTLASLLCGSARTMEGLICARVIQGMAGGLLTPLTQLMMARVAGKQMARVLGYASVPVLLAPLLGPLLAGTILRYADWSWLFYVNLPMGILGVVLAASFIPHDEALIQKRTFDLPGFFLISPALVCLLYGFNQASHHGGIWILVLGLVLLGAFLRHGHRKKSAALIDLELFKIPVFSAAATTQFLANGILYAGQFLIPLYLITGCGLSPEKAGWTLAAMGGGMMCVYPLMGYLTDRFGCRAVASGGVSLNFLGTLPFLWMTQGKFSIPLSIAALFVRGLGQGGTGIPSLSAAYSSVPEDKLSFATTAINIVQRLGGPTMTTALAAVMAFSENSSSTSASHSFFIPFVALILFQLVVFGSTLRLPVRIHQDIEPGNAEGI